MRLSDVVVRGTLHRVRLGTVEHRVVRIPLDGRLVGEVSCETVATGGFGVEAARHLAVGWALAARSRHTLVYFSIRPASSRDGRVRDPLPESLGDYPDLDLLLVPRDAGLRASRWPDLRRRLGAGSPTSVQLPPSAFAGELPAQWRRAGSLDAVRVTEVARTMVLTGTGAGFTADLDRLRAFGEVLPAELAARPAAHHGVELGWDTGAPTLRLELARDGGELRPLPGRDAQPPAPVPQFGERESAG